MVDLSKVSIKITNPIISGIEAGTGALWLGLIFVQAFMTHMVLFVGSV